MTINSPDLRFSIPRLLSELAFARAQTSLLKVKHALTERVPFDFVSAANDGPVLLVGEGNLSFAFSLALKMGSNATMLRATTCESRRNLSCIAQRNAHQLNKLGVGVLHGVDASRLEERFPVTRFKLVVFQFPNVASRKPIYGRNPNHVLIRCFLRSARNVLASSGRVAITVIDSPHRDGVFAMHDAAQSAGLSPPCIYHFRLSDHLGYDHSNTQNANESAIIARDRLQTYVFGR